MSDQQAYQEVVRINKADLRAAADVLNFVVGCDGDTSGWKIRLDLEGQHHKYLDDEALIAVARLAARLLAASEAK